MRFKFYLIILFCLSQFVLLAQIEVEWTKTSFDYDGIEDYLGVYPLTTFDGKALLAHKLVRKTAEEQFSYGYELLDVATGDATGDLISTQDFSVFDTLDIDPELTDLIRTENGYMTFLRNRNQVTFVKYDENLKVVNPEAVSSPSVEFDPSTFLYGYGNTESAATSYGMIGAAWGVDDNTAQSEAIPHLFACDADLNVRFAKRLENASYYLGNRFLIATNGADEIFTAGHIKGQERIRADTIVISKLAADGELLYTNYLTLEPNSVPRVLKMDISADGTELLISGIMFIVDEEINRNTTKAYVARINAQDGSLIKLFNFLGRELGGSSSSNLELPMAQYDTEGDIMLTTIMLDGQIDINAIQMDLEGTIFDNINILSDLGGFPYPYAYRLNKIGGNQYLSGSYRVDSEQKEAFLAKISPREITADIADDIATPISFKTSPNPTNGSLTIQWNNEVKGDYQIRIINQLGQAIQRYRGEVFPGQVNLEFNIEHLPAGTYFIGLEMENRFARQTIIKD